MKWVGCLLMSLVCVLVAFLRGVGAEHTPDTAWMAKYRNAQGISCCGVTDCQVARVSLVRQAGDKMVGLINGVEVTLPAQSVHPSETPHTYWCSETFALPPAPAITRCVFYAMGS